MKKTLLTLSLVAVAALAGCSNDKPAAPKAAAAPAAAAKAAPQQPAKTYPSVYANAELAPLAKALQGSMTAISQMAGDRTAPVTDQDMALFSEHERHRMALLGKIKDQYEQAAALREVHQNAFKEGGGQVRRAYQLNVRRIREAAMMARAQARRAEAGAPAQPQAQRARPANGSQQQAQPAAR